MRGIAGFFRQEATGAVDRGRAGYAKAILRQALVDDVPKDILWKRSKLAFRTPVERWFRERPEGILYPVLKSEA